MKFSDYGSTGKLEKLVDGAPDLTKPKVLSAERIKKMSLCALNWKMNYATERVNDEICLELCNLAKDANVMDKMWMVQDMEMMNYVNNCESERRKVGHTAIRHPKPGSEHSDDVHAASEAYKAELKKLGKFLSKEADKFKHMVVIGIGGSYLGALAMIESLENFKTNDREVHFSSNIDPDLATSILNEIDLKETIVVIISKSGGTLEIKAQAELFRLEFEKAGLDTKKHFAMVTGEGSPMDKPDAYLEIFYLWDYIGGRYSVSSMVGAVPIAFLFGMRIWEDFLKGMHDMDKHALTEKNPMKNLPLWGALLGIWNRNFLKCSTYAIIPYSSPMKFYSLHMQQLFMESNGKSVCKEDCSFVDWETCGIIWGTVGTEGQHSYYQGIHQGTQNVPIEFIGFKNAQLEGDEIIEGSTNQEKLVSNLIAQALALAAGQSVPNNNQCFSGNRQSHMLLADQLDAYTLGTLLAYHEHYVAFQGFIWNVNSFDQEGVQLGKILANQVIELFREKRERGSVSLSKDNEAARALINELDSICENRNGNNNMRSA